MGAQRCSRPSRPRHDRCAGFGCRRQLPKLALRYQDRFCSTRCARIAYGTWRPIGMKGIPERSSLFLSLLSCGGEP
jgi:endogenous inhibitor of DNA gyrase (YacG/DUF329 family)